MTVAFRLYAYCITGDGSTLIIICRRGQGRIKTKLGLMLLSRKGPVFFLAFKSDHGPIPLACDATTVYWRQVNSVLGYRHWRQCRHQLAVVHVYFGPQLEISRTGVSIKSTAGRPSGWALPRILVFIISEISILQEDIFYNSVDLITDGNGLWFRSIAKSMTKQYSDIYKKPIKLYRKQIVEAGCYIPVHRIRTV